jgi:NADPH:quinone reductase-like Zn-dependent oxidoreductase
MNREVTVKRPAGGDRSRTMRAVFIRAFGGPEVLEFGELPRPEVRPGHVLVKVAAVGINYYDTLIRSGAVSRDIALPHVPGSDVVGRIAALGQGVTGLALEDPVIVAPGYPTNPAEYDFKPENEAPSFYPAGTFAWGGYAEFMEVDSRWIVPDDTGLPPEALATMPLVLATAMHAVKTLGGVHHGSRVLVQAGASGSGSMAIQVAKALGAHVITTVSTDRKADLARRMGADEVVLYRGGRVAERVRAWSGGAGVDVIIDPVGGIAMPDNVQSLRPRGIIVNFGLSGGAEATIPHLYPFFRNELRLVGSWMGSMAELREGLELVRQGRIKPALDRILPLSSAQDVHRLVAEAGIAGKVALIP